MSDAFFSLVTRVKQLFNLDECQIAYALFEARFPAAGLFCACQRHGGRSYAQKEQKATLPQDRSEAPRS